MSKNGFTLIELTVALGIFASLVVGVVGVTIQLMSAQQKAAAIQAVMDNLRFNLELMSREMRTGLDFQSFDGFCPGMVGGPENSIEFLSFNQGPRLKRIYYIRDSDGDGFGDTIMRIANSTDCDDAEPFTSEEVMVENVEFILRGEGAYPTDGQPFVTVALRVRSRSPKVITETRMNLQITVAQRVRDL